MPNFNFTATPSSDTLTLGVVRRSAEEVFPETIQFEVTDYSGAGFTTVTDGEYNEELHLEHFWSFDDSYSFSAPTQNVAFAVSTGYSAFANAGTSRATKPAHTYRAAGTYNVTVSVWGYVSGTLTEATGSMSVTVGSADFSGTNTIHIDPDGTHATKPTGAQEATTFSAAVALLSGTTPKRIMFRTGVTHTISNTVSFNSSSSARTVHIVSDTPGTKATIDCTSMNGAGRIAMNWNAPTTQPSAIDWVVQDLDMEGPNTPASDKWNSGEDEIALGIANDGPQQFLMDRVNIDKFGIGFYSVATSDSGFHAMNDSVIEGYQQFGFYDFVRGAGLFTGLRLMTSVDTNSDHVGNNLVGEPYRGGAGAMAVFDKCDCFNRIEANSTGREVLRLATNGTNNDQAYVSQCVMEGMNELIDLGAVNPDTSTEGNFVIANNIFMGGYRTSTMVTVKATGVTIKNNIFFVPTSGTRISDVNNFVNFENALTGWKATADRDRPVRSFSNTMVALGDGFNPASEFSAGTTGFGSEYNDTLDSNNLTHQPGITGGPTVSNLETTSRLTQRFVGYFTGSPNTFASPLSSSTSDDPLATYAPLTGSSAIGAASSGTTASHDFYGNNRVAIAASHTRSPSTGAIEPDLAS